MGSCCENKEVDLAKTAREHRSVLWIVLAINLIMFLVELGYGLASDSTALIGDSLDMLGDAITYGSSILVVGLGAVEKARVARLKAAIMLIFGLAISIRCVYRGFYPVVPDFGTMFIVGIIALVMNLLCLIFLTKHRDDDVNMQSVWICSRNDIIANLSVLAAALVVSYTSSAIPDLVVGIGLAFLFTWSAAGIIRSARLAMNTELAQTNKCRS